MKMDSMTRYRWQSAGYLGGEGDPDGGGDDGSGCGCGCVIAFYVALVVIAYVSSFIYGS